MPNKAFLHKKSLIDKFRDDRKKGTGYIQAARARRTWNNPMTRKKRTNKLNDWITSFAGKRHIRKLSRFNALKESNTSMDDTKAFIKYTDDVLDILTTMYDVSRDELKSPLFMDMFDYIDSYWYLEKTPEDCAKRLSKVFSLKDKSEAKETEEKLGYEKGHKNSRGEDAPWVIRSHKDNRVLASFASEEDAKEHLKRMKQFSKEESKKSEAVKLTYVDTIRVPQWMWEANKTGDTSNLEDDEIEMLKEFQLEYKDNHLDDKGEDPYFSSHNDFDSLGGNVYDIDVYEIDTKSEKVSKMKESKQTKEFPYKFKFNFYSTRTIGYVEDAIKELGIGDVQDIPEDGLFVYVKEPTDILKVVDKAIAIGNEAGSDLTTGDMYRTVGSANKYGILSYGDREVVADAGTEYGVSWTYFDLAKDDSDNYIQAVGELDDIVDFFVAIK